VKSGYVAGATELDKMADIVGTSVSCDVRYSIYNYKVRHFHSIFPFNTTLEYVVDIMSDF